MKLSELSPRPCWFFLMLHGWQTLYTTFQSRRGDARHQPGARRPLRCVWSLESVRRLRMLAAAGPACEQMPTEAIVGHEEHVPCGLSGGIPARHVEARNERMLRSIHLLCSSSSANLRQWVPSYIWTSFAQWRGGPYGCYHYMTI